MKFIKSRNKNKEEDNRKTKQVSQGTGGDILMRKIYSRKRGYKKSKVMVRQCSGWAKRVFIIGLVVGVVAYGIYILDIRGFFSISEIEIIGADEFVNKDDLRKLAETNGLGNFIFTFNTSDLEGKLRGNFLGAYDIDIEKKYPRSIKVIVEERVPLAIVKSSKDDQRYLVDKSGYVLSVISSRFSSFPIIHYDGEVSVGIFLTEKIFPVSAEILRFADSEGVRISTMSFYPKYVRLYTNTGVDVYIGAQKDIEESMKAIGALLRKLSLEGKKVTKVDLRYDKVIVLYD